MRKRSTYRPKPIRVPVTAGIVSAFREALTTAEVGMHMAPGEYHFDALVSVAEIVRLYALENSSRIDSATMRQLIGGLRTLQDLSVCPQAPTHLQLESIHLGREAMLAIIARADVVGLELARRRARENLSTLPVAQDQGQRDQGRGSQRPAAHSAPQEVRGLQPQPQNH